MFIIHRNHEFNSSLAQEAANLFIGCKDFRAFMGKSLNPDVITQRSIEELTISKTSSLLPSEESNHYNFWQVTCTGKSFLFRQVNNEVFQVLLINFLIVYLLIVLNIFIF